MAIGDIMALLGGNNDQAEAVAAVDAFVAGVTGEGTTEASQEAEEGDAEGSSDEDTGDEEEAEDEASGDATGDDAEGNEEDSTNPIAGDEDIEYNQGNGLDQATLELRQRLAYESARRLDSEAQVEHLLRILQAPTHKHFDDLSDEERSRYIEQSETTGIDPVVLHYMDSREAQARDQSARESAKAAVMAHITNHPLRPQLAQRVAQLMQENPDAWSLAETLPPERLYKAGVAIANQFFEIARLEAMQNQAKASTTVKAEQRTKRNQLAAATRGETSRAKAPAPPKRSAPEAIYDDIANAAKSLDPWSRL